MIKVVLDQDITISSIGHTSGFNYSIGSYSFKSDDGLEMSFTISPHFYRRWGDGISGSAQWDPPNVGVKSSCESYLRLSSYNCKGLPFRYTVKIRNSSYTSEWVTNYEYWHVSHGMGNAAYTFDESEISEFLDDYKRVGKTLPAHLTIEVDYGGISDEYPFQQNTLVTANYQELKDIVVG